MTSRARLRKRLDTLQERIQAALDAAMREQARQAYIRSLHSNELRHLLPDGSYETIQWERWMGPKDNLRGLLQAIGVATEMEQRDEPWNGPMPLAQMRREFDRIMARRPTHVHDAEASADASETDERNNA